MGLLGNTLRGNLGFKGDGATIDVSEKVDGVTTITCTDNRGTQVATINDGEITKAMVIDSLTSDITDQPLSAKQGKVLNESYATLSNTVSGKIDTADIVDALNSTATDQPLSANQGKILKTSLDNVYRKSDFIVFNGEMTVGAADTESVYKLSSKQLTIPADCSQYNLVPIGFTIKSSKNSHEYVSGLHVGTSTDLLLEIALNSLPRDVIFIDGDLYLKVGNCTTSSFNIYYTVICLKYKEGTGMVI